MKKRTSREAMEQKFEAYEVPDFDQKLRGYDREAVDHYLHALVEAYNEMYAACEALRAANDAHLRFREQIANSLIAKELAQAAQEEHHDDETAA